MTDHTKIIAEQPTPTLSMHPRKFALWLFIVTVVMLFGAFTSAYIVRQGEGNWLQFELPQVFYVSTAVIALSSATMHWAYLSAKRNELPMLKIAMALTVLLGLGFLVTQFMGWQALVEAGVFFAGTQSNPSGSFLYVLSGLHGIHLVGGVVFLAAVLYNTFRYRVHSKSMTGIEMCATYWHFLGGLWVYLLVFLITNN